MTRQRGLTLVEVMIALAIFALISAAAMGIFRIAISAHDSLEAASTRSGEMMRLQTMLQNDLAQMVARQGRDEDGNRLPGPLAGGNFLASGSAREEEGAQLLFALTRTGNGLAGSVQRSDLQYVEYLFAEGKLVRRSWDWPDRQPETPMLEQVLAKNLTGADIRFFNGLEWRDRWLSGDGAGSPRAIALDIGHEKWGQMPLIFYTAGGAS